MKKILFLILTLLITVNLYATPDNTMTISSVSSGGTIEASEHNTARSTISSTFNAHSHTDIITLSSLASIGTITTGVWNGTAVGVLYGGTGTTTASGARTNLGLVIGTDVQAYDVDLTTYAGITPSANIQSLLGSADYAAARTNLGVAIGTNVQAYDADLDDLADGTLSVARGGTGQTTTGLAFGGKTVTWSGNGVDDRNIAHGLGRTPIIVIITKIENTANVPVIWMTGYTASYSMSIETGTMAVDKIQSVDATNVQIGTNTQVNNGDGSTYIMFVM